LPQVTRYRSFSAISATDSAVRVCCTDNQYPIILHLMPLRLR
jgi:hypothetical protein